MARTEILAVGFSVVNKPAFVKRSVVGEAINDSFGSITKHTASMPPENRFLPSFQTTTVPPHHCIPTPLKRQTCTHFTPETVSRPCWICFNKALLVANKHSSFLGFLKWRFFRFRCRWGIRSGWNWTRLHFRGGGRLHWSNHFRVLRLLRAVVAECEQKNHVLKKTLTGVCVVVAVVRFAIWEPQWVLGMHSKTLRIGRGNWH